MTSSDFKKIVQARFEKCLDLMFGEKDLKYNRNNDKFHNFKVAGRMLGITPVQALKGMWIKQLVSIFDVIDYLDRGILPSDEMLGELVSDNVNYLLLLEGLITEKKDNKNKTGRIVPMERLQKHEK